MSSDDSVESTAASKSRTVCALCRQRKTRCDRRLPKCGFCIKAKIECQYLPLPNKRGLRAGYVSELESRIESLEDQVEALRQPSTVVPIAPESTAVQPHDHNTTPSVVNTLQGVQRDLRSTQVPNHVSESNAAIADMMTLPPSYFRTLSDLWFKEDQHWVPILQYDHIQSSLDALPSPVNHIVDIVLRAVIALKIAYSSQAISLGYKGRRRLSLHLRSQVLAEAMSEPQLSSIQALFIIALLDYGSDDITSTFNIMSMCRRTGEHIGIFQQLLQRIESQSPAQIGPPTRETFAGDSAPIALTWAVLSFDTVSSLGVSWRDVSAALVDHLSGVAYLSIPDFRDSFRTHIHLSAIGIQPVHEFFFAYAKGQHQVLDGDTLATTEDMYQNLMSYVRGMPSSGYTILADGAVDFDLNHVFTRLLSNASVIMIYQRYLFDSKGETMLARERCLDSYQQMIDIVRNISDADAEFNSPSFAHFIAVGARFKLVFDRALELQRDPAFDVLMHDINMCGRRWPLARRLDIILRAAIIEVDSGVLSGMPGVFWDLKQSNLDISEIMKRWVHDYKPSLYVGSLNGPYT